MFTRAGSRPARGRRHALAGKRFIQLDEVKVRDRQPARSSALRTAGIGPSPSRRIHPGHRIARHGPSAATPGASPLGFHQQCRGRAVVDAARVAGRHGAASRESGRSRARASEVVSGRGCSFLRHDERVALALRDRNGHELVAMRPSRLPRRRGVAARGSILVLATHAQPLGHVSPVSPIEIGCRPPAMAD